MSGLRDSNSKWRVRGQARGSARGGGGGGGGALCARGAVTQDQDDEMCGWAVSALEVSSYFGQGMLLLMSFEDGACTSPRNNPFGPCAKCRR